MAIKHTRPFTKSVLIPFRLPIAPDGYHHGTKKELHTTRYRRAKSPSQALMEFFSYKIATYGKMDAV
jgi:hypothetical protein